MQFMGSRLKQAGYKGVLGPQLVEPKANVEAGCCILRNCFGNGQTTMRMVLTNWYGLDRRGLVGSTLAMIPVFAQFVAERPIPAGTTLAG